MPVAPLTKIVMKLLFQHSFTAQILDPVTPFISVLLNTEYRANELSQPFDVDISKYSLPSLMKERSTNFLCEWLTPPYDSVILWSAVPWPEESSTVNYQQKKKGETLAKCTFVYKIMNMAKV